MQAFVPKRFSELAESDWDAGLLQLTEPIGLRLGWMGIADLHGQQVCAMTLCCQRPAHCGVGQANGYYEAVLASYLRQAYSRSDVSGQVIVSAGYIDHYVARFVDSAPLMRTSPA